VSHFKSLRAVEYERHHAGAAVPRWNPFDPPRNKMARRKPALPIVIGQPIPRARKG
jgi:hypothetical protein